MHITNSADLEQMSYCKPGLSRQTYRDPKVDDGRSCDQTQADVVCFPRLWLRQESDQPADQERLSKVETNQSKTRRDDK